MTTIFKIIVSVIMFGECLRYMCTGFVTILVQCKIIMKSLYDYCNLLSVGICNLGLQWRVMCSTS
jgi:hypothetical protein